jgi:predicted Holliday junction resolvase-like endonuclease
MALLMIYLFAVFLTENVPVFVCACFKSLFVDILVENLITFFFQISEVKGQLDLQHQEIESLQARHDDRVRQLQREHEAHIEQMGQQQSQVTSPQQQQV